MLDLRQLEAIRARVMLTLSTMSPETMAYRLARDVNELDAEIARLRAALIAIAGDTNESWTSQHANDALEGASDA